MSENRNAETKLREQQEIAASSRAQQPSGHLVLKIVGGVALALVATGVIASLHDIRRYLKMVRM